MGRLTMSLIFKAKNKYENGHITKCSISRKKTERKNYSIVLPSLFLLMAGCSGLQSTTAFGGDCLMSIFSTLTVRFNLSSVAIDAAIGSNNHLLTILHNGT